MKKWLQPNLSFPGRVVRGIGALALLIAGGILVSQGRWWGVGLLAGGAFVLLEALRGWCVLRACGIKTKVGTRPP